MKMREETEKEREDKIKKRHKMKKKIEDTR